MTGAPNGAVPLPCEAARDALSTADDRDGRDDGDHGLPDSSRERDPHALLVLPPAQKVPAVAGPRPALPVPDTLSRP